MSLLMTGHLPYALVIIFTLVVVGLGGALFQKVVMERVTGSRGVGVQLVIAKNIEKIYGQNCQNIGLLTSTDFGLLARIERGDHPIDGRANCECLRGQALRFSLADALV